MRILVTGATGFIGRRLVADLLADGHDVLALVHRRPLDVAAGAPAPRTIGSFAELPPDLPVDAVVNLAGAPILGPPWTAGRRRLLEASRIGVTDALVAWLRGRTQRPSVLVSASAVGWYGTRGQETVDETAAPKPEQYQSRICLDWERSAEAAAALGVRVCCLRFGIVLGHDGGALPPLARPVRLGVGARLGDGRQGMPWIHVDDAVALIRVALRDDALSGAVNAVAPDLVSHDVFQDALARVLHRPLLLRIPAAPLRWLLGEMAQLLVDGQYVLPTRALAAGYVFRWPRLEEALRDALSAAARSPAAPGDGGSPPRSSPRS